VHKDIPTAMQIADRLKRLLQAAGESNPSWLKDDGTPNQNQIAVAISEKTGKSFHQSSLSRMLKGEVENPSMRILVPLAAILEMTASELRERLLDDGKTVTAAAPTKLQKCWPFDFTRDDWSALPAEDRSSIKRIVDRMVRDAAREAADCKSKPPRRARQSRAVG